MNEVHDETFVLLVDISVDLEGVEVIECVYVDEPNVLVRFLRVWNSRLVLCPGQHHVGWHERDVLAKGSHGGDHEQVGG